MIFVDTDLLMYAVGGAHPLRAPALAFFQETMREGRQLVTSAEVLQELLHAYLPVGRVETLDAALTLADACIPVVWPIEGGGRRSRHPGTLAGRHSSLGARDLLHLAWSRRHGARQIKTFDRGLAAAFADDEWRAAAGGLVDFRRGTAEWTKGRSGS